nr:DUF4198 domain-containing protein [Hyphomonas sediminis]
MAALPAAAHTGYILPDSFDYKSCSGLGAIATFSDYFPAPEIVLSVPEFHLTGPTGPVAFDSVRADHAMSRLEASLDVPGTYRITTGARLGRKGKVALLDGAYVRLEGSESLPGGTRILSSQTATVSDTYFSCGGAETAIDTAPPGQLGVIPLTEDDAPDDMRAFRVTFDGAGFAPDEAYLIPAYASFAGAHDGQRVTVAEDGVLRLEGLVPGVYVLLARHIAPAPNGAETDVRSHSTTVTFAVGGSHAEH